MEVEVPPLRYLMIDSMGDPNGSQEYTQAIVALFSVSYTAKFATMREATLDYGGYSFERPLVGG